MLRSVLKWDTTLVIGAVAGLGPIPCMCRRHPGLTCHDSLINVETTFVPLLCRVFAT
jgi:hypothetical protein